MLDERVFHVVYILKIVNKIESIVLHFVCLSYIRFNLDASSQSIKTKIAITQFYNNTTKVNSKTGNNYSNNGLMFSLSKVKVIIIMVCIGTRIFDWITNSILNKNIIIIIFHMRMLMRSHCHVITYKTT